MPWYRTTSGHLVHAVGEVAGAYAARGAVEVSDDVAVAEVESGAAQAAADAAAVADAASSDHLPTPPSPPAPDDGPASVPQMVVEHAVSQTLTPEVQAMVETAIADETNPSDRRARP